MQPIGFDGLSGNADFHVFAKNTPKREKTRKRAENKRKATE